jgi:catechol-2,3-dioxygenase
VLDLLRHGMSRREIARARGTTLDAVKYHLENISGKLGLSASSELRHWPGFPITSALGRKEQLAMEATSQTAGTAGGEGQLGLGPLGQVSMRAKDVKRVEAFYRDVLGLPHVFTFGDLTFFDLGGTRLYIQARPEKDWVPSSILYFLVDDLARAYEALKSRGVRFQGAPHMIYEDETTGTQEWMAFFDDSEGNTLAIMARVRPEGDSAGG